MDELTIVIVEDDPHACNEFTKYADEMDDFTIVSITNNADTALQNILHYHPHVLILDIELHNGKGNGLALLSKLQQMDLKVRPYILITTNNTSSVTYDSARNLGADFIMSKHQEDYSEENVLLFLKLIERSIKNKLFHPSGDSITPESPEQHEKRLIRRIMEELNLIGISPKAMGYQYLIDAILITINGPTQNITTLVGQKHGKTECSVERAMFNAINKAWRESDIEDLSKYYTARIRSTRGIPTLTEFICYYANKIKSEE